MSRILITGGCGYIGSALYRHLYATGHGVAVVDKLDRGNSGDIPVQVWDYRFETAWNFEQCDTIIHLAGHSSVAQCEADPWGAVDNNLTGFIPFLRTLSELEKPPLLLWASSGSVLSDVTSIYDTTKRSLEALVPRLYPRSIGLRFASVCGVSPNQRDDLILNAMARSAVANGYLTVSNPYISKPVLGLKDLCAHVAGIIDRGGDMAGPIENMSSIWCTPERAALAVMEATGCEVRVNGPSAAYDFEMVPDNEPTETLDSIIADLVKHYRGQNV